MIYPPDITDYPTFKQLEPFYSRVHFSEEENAQIILGQKNLEFFFIMSEKREVQKKVSSFPTLGNYLRDLHKHAYSRIRKERFSLKFSSNNQFRIIESVPSTAFVH